MAKRKRVRSRHPGVKIKRMKRARGDTWVARWIDPETGAEKQESLSSPLLGLTTEEARLDWAKKKSRSLQELRQAITSGTAVTTCTPPKEAVSSFFDTQEAELKQSTLLVYREATGPFETWAGKTGLACIEDLTPAKLTAFRDWFVARPARVQAKGAKTGRGARKVSKRKRSPGQINKCLRSARTVLNYWRKRGLTPALTSDAIRDHLEFVKAPKPLPHFLRANEVGKLLEAATRHDAEADDGKGHKHPPIRPFVVAALLTGMRFGELANLRWDDVDLDAGEIRLQAEATKTGHGRVIGLDVTPALAAMLTSMKLQAGESRHVFGPMQRDVAESARKRLQKSFNAPKGWSWHDLRRTCGTFLTCAPSIYGAASAFLSAKRLGHSVAVSEKHYAGQLHGIPADAHTLEAAMEVAELLPKPAQTRKPAKSGA